MSCMCVMLDTKKTTNVRALMRAKSRVESFLSSYRVAFYWPILLRGESNSESGR